MTSKASFVATFPSSVRIVINCAAEIVDKAYKGYLLQFLAKFLLEASGPTQKKKECLLWTIKSCVPERSCRKRLALCSSSAKSLLARQILHNHVFQSSDPTIDTWSRPRFNFLIRRSPWLKKTRRSMEARWSGVEFHRSNWRRDGMGH